MPSQGRSLHPDNIKAALIFLVVFGHLIEPNIAHDGLLKTVWLFIYAFHMPMFVLVSGMFSRPSLGESEAQGLVKNIVAPLAAFELLYEGLEFAMTGSASNYFELSAPYWMLWYLVSLLCWRLMLPVFSRLRFPVAIAMLVAMAASYLEDAGYFFSISRTLTFFPFFLLGWRYRERLLLPPSGRLTAACIAALAALFAAASQFHDWDYRLLYGSYSLAALQMADGEGLAWQLLLYLVSTVGGLAFLNLVPRRDVGIARIGVRSMHPYLWHGFVVIALSSTGALAALFSLGSLAAMAALALISIAVLAVASHDIPVSLTNRLILEPAARLLQRQPREQPARPVRSSDAPARSEERAGLATRR